MSSARNRSLLSSKACSMKSRIASSSHHACSSSSSWVVSVGSLWPPGKEQGAPRVHPQRILQVVHGLLVNGALAVVDQGAGEQHGQHEDPRVVLGVALEQRPQVLTLSSSPTQDPFRHEPECPDPECCQPASHGKTIP